MVISENSPKWQQSEIDSLRAQLAEAQEVLKAIRGGQIDALVVDSPEGARIFTVAGAERPYRVFIEQMGEGAASLTPDGTVLFSNQQFASLLQLPASKTTGRNLCEFLSPQDANRFRSLIATPSAEPKRTELVLKQRTGAGIPVYLSASVFEDGGIRTVCVIASDQTQQKRAEEKLRDASKMEALGQLTAGIAHDFNNLLMAILGNLNVLRRQLDSVETLNRVSRAEQSVLRGAKLVQQLLAFARKQRLNLEPIKLNQVIANALNLIEGTIGRSIEVVTRLRPAIWNVWADVTQVEMMLVNLALNARDAMPDGGQLQIETQNVTVPNDAAPADLEHGQYVRVSVIDNGSGMTEDTRAKAIEPFYTTKRAGSGSGLGLSQVYGLAKQFGGSVQIESQRGKGTVVHFYLPRAGKETAHVADASPTGAAEANAKAELVLIVDDDPDVRSLVADFIDMLGYRTMTADGAQAALEILTTDGNVDVLISDVVMPGMNGFQLAEQVRSTLPELPILLMSGYADYAKLNPGSLGVALIEKPFQLDDIEPVLGRLLHQRLGQDSGEAR